MKKKKIAFYTMGCKLNYAETSTIARKFSDLYYQHVSFKDYADIYIINSCSVTNNAENKFRYIIRYIMRRNAKARIIATGCYAQFSPKKVAAIKGVDIVLGNKFNIFNLIHSNIKEIDLYPKKDYLKKFFPSFSIGKRTRSFLKIQDGCNYKCSYCIIPISRGYSRSDKIQNILKNISFLSEKGVKEIVLTGINIGDYQSINNQGNIDKFFDLIQHIENYIFNEKKELRIRLSSIEPNLLKKEHIEFISQSKYFVPHFHIPLQSGNNDILKNMRRRYKKELYTHKINQIKSMIPNAYIGSDIIVGFPGETNKNFLESYFFIKKLSISSMHVFTYSSRPNTKSILMDQKVPKNIKMKRNRILNALSIHKYQKFCKKQILLGEKKTVLFEKNYKKDPYIYGYTENYIRTKILKSSFNYENSLQNVKLKYIDKDGIVIAEII